MNSLAKQHFAEHPEARYWYYSANLRVPNPRIARDPRYTPDPWPDDET